MSQAADAHHGHLNSAGEHGPHHPASYYVKIWALLLVLLVISIAGPMLGNKVLTLITAFGIAVVKALIVAAFFMHLNVEKKFVWYMLFAMLLAVVMFFLGTAADVMKYDGSHWTKPSSYLYTEEFKKAFSGGEEHEGHGSDEFDSKALPNVPYGETESHKAHGSHETEGHGLPAAEPRHGT
jgi:caa(3)-type oxidase subunit IV